MPRTKSLKYGIDSLNFFSAQIWALVPSELKVLNDLKQFKEKIRQWIPVNCPCRLCKIYIHGVGYLNVVT